MNLEYNFFKNMKHIISINDFDGDKIFNDILPKCKEKIKFAKKRIPKKFSPQKKVTFAFFEPSTRTRGSYVEASRLLGWEKDVILSKEATSLSKKESIANTARMLAIQGADVLVIRTKIEGAPKFAAEVLEKDFNISVQNAGDGTNQHPTQTFLDLLTIKEKIGRLDDLKIGFCGDLKYGRTVHSLLSALSHRKKISLVLASDPSTALQERYKKPFKNIIEGDSLDVFRNCDIIYLTRLQRERFQDDPVALKRAEGKFQITQKDLDTFKKDVIIMHPLPYVNEISPEIRLDKRVLIDQQAWYGVPVRTSLLEHGYKNRNQKLNFNIIADSQFKTLKEETLAQYFSKRQKGKKSYEYFRPIESGTVIDHIPRGLAFKIRNYLIENKKIDGGIKHIIEDIQSRKSDSIKDVLVLDNMFLDKESTVGISSLAPSITINIIKNKKFKKIKIKNPSLINIGKCPNVNCITNHDREAKPKFISSDNAVNCYFCEKQFTRREILE